MTARSRRRYLRLELARKPRPAQVQVLQPLVQEQVLVLQPQVLVRVQEPVLVFRPLELAQEREQQLRHPKIQLLR